jgi:carbon starvation protein
MGRTDWMPGTILSSVLVVAGWSYFIFTGSISTIWPMFGISNQLLAAIALCIGTTLIINMGRAKYALVTLLPLTFVSSTTLTAGYRSIMDNFLPLARSTNPGEGFQGMLNIVLTVIMMACLVIGLVDSISKWQRVLTQ